MVARGLDVAVAGEARVAVAVAAQVARGDPVARHDQRRRQEAVGGAQVAHARDEHDERPVAVDVVPDAPLGAGQVGGTQQQAGEGQGTTGSVVQRSQDEGGGAA